MKIPGRLLIALILMLFIAEALPTIQAQESLSELVKSVLPSVVSIITYNEADKALSQGSGFFITQEGEVITNRHVLEGASRADIVMSNGSSYAITNVVAEDKDGDLVRVGADLKGRKALSLIISASTPEKGERVMVIGSPMGLEMTVSDGIVSATREIPDFGRVLQITAPISSGSSGSPVLNMKGEVIGIATFIIVEGQNLNFAISAERLKELPRGKVQNISEWEAARLSTSNLSGEASYKKGMGFFQAGDWAKALSWFTMATRENPDNNEAFFKVGYCRYQLGNYEGAIEAYNISIRLEPNQPGAFHNLGVVNQQLNRFQEAADAFMEAIRLSPDKEESHQGLGLMYCEMKRFHEAIGEFNEAVRINPNNAQAHHNLGVTYYRIGLYKESLEAMIQAIRNDPDEPSSFNSLGLTYVKLDQYRDAIDAFRQAIRINPNYVDAHFHLGLTYLLAKDRGSALDEYKTLKDLDSQKANDLFNLIYQ